MNIEDRLVSKLTPRQRVFCDHYLITLSAKESALEAGYAKKNAAIIGAMNLNKKHIKEYISFKMDERSKRTDITADRVIQEISKLAFAKISDIAEVTNDGVVLKDLSNIDISCISEAYEVSTSKDNKNVRVKIHDKTKNLELLGKHLGIFKEKVEYSGNLQIENWLRNGEK